MQPMIDYPEASNNISNDNLYNRVNYNASPSVSPAETASNIDNGSNSLPDRDFNYVANDASDQAIARGGVACPFPWRLHEMLKLATAEGLDEIVSWAPHGRAFIVRKPKEFASRVMTRFFCQTKFASFQRQLNLYGFQRFAHGRDKGAYYHSAFVRGKRCLVKHMVRCKVKGTQTKQCRPLPAEEPDFYDISVWPQSPDEHQPSYVTSSSSRWEPSFQAYSQGNPLPRSVSDDPCTDISDEDEGSSYSSHYETTDMFGADLSFLDHEAPLAWAPPPEEAVAAPPQALDPLAEIRRQIQQRKQELLRLEPLRPGLPPLHYEGISLYKGSYISV